jgi:phage baseplate assembly protein W
MSRPIYQYKPINDTPDQAIGVLLPLNRAAQGKAANTHYASGSNSGGGVFVSSYTTKDAAITNLKNLVLTEKGERYMQPNFGTNIRTILFDNNTEDIRSILETTVNEDVKYWLPYITMNNVDVIPSADMHSLTVALYFRITSVGANVVINILASENDFVVTAEEVPTELVQTGTFSADTAFGLGDGGSY